LLAGAHAFIAFARREPHWQLSDQDARAYGLALSNALRHIPILVAQKYVDFSALALAVMTYDGPRLMLSAQAKATPQQQAQTAKIFSFNPPGTPSPAAPHPSQSQGPRPESTQTATPSPAKSPPASPASATGLGPLEFEPDVPTLGP
jgi:hypothetical protein